jgi:pimeloyl-ACP methyl ester carboxylesterase
MGRVHRWIRRLWITAGLCFMAWLAWNTRARGVDPALLRSTGTVAVLDSGPFLRFTPRTGEAEAGLIFLPGATVDPTAYVPLLRAVAEAGHPVVLVRLPWRVAPSASSQARVSARIDEVRRSAPTRRWWLAGHSRGAALAARFAGAAPEAFAGLLLIGTTHPKEASLASLPIPVIKIYGTHDCVADSAAIFDNAHLLPPSTRFVRIEGANHQQFGFYGTQLGDCRATISREDQQAGTLEVLLAALATSDTPLPPADPM